MTEKLAGPSDAELSSRVWTLPNALSFLRLAGVPLFLYLVLVAERDGVAILLLMASGITDYLDGYIARRYSSFTRIGQLLDPLADRLYILATLLALVVRDGIPWWWAGAIVGRDVLLGIIGLTYLRRHGFGPLPVHFLGKAATFNLLFAFPMLLAALPGNDGLLADVFRPLGWAFAAWGSVLYLWAGVLYVVQVRQVVREAQSGGESPVRAVVMAGGEGSRLRPLTANQPKPLLPVANRPLLEHVLRLLRRHGTTDTVVTVQFLASMVRTYFGDGDELGMNLTYATEQTPLGTAGSVRGAADALRGEPFLVLSGDALTDVDLTALAQAHRDRGSLVTVCLARRPDPLDFGIVITDEDGRIERFLEKPTWGQVFSDTVSTGIYVMEPEVLARVPPGEQVDWSADVLPALLAEGAPVHGWVADGYWEDVGTHDSYRRAHADVLTGRVDVQVDGFEVAPGVWVGEGAEVDPDAEVVGPCLIGPHSKVEAGARVGELTVLGSNVVVKGGARLERAVVHDNAFIGPQATLRGCVLGKNSDVMRAARVEEGAVVGDECVVQEEAYLGSDVMVYPFKTIDAGAVLHTSVIWGRGSSTLFGPRGVSGLVNVEVTPESVVRLASAYATTLGKGTVVTVARDASRAARALERAVVAALTASAIDVHDLDVVPLPVARFTTATTDAVGGVLLRTTPGDPQSIDIVFLDGDGADLSAGAQRRLERVLSRREFRRAFPDEIAELTHPTRTLDTYVRELLRTVDVTGVGEAGLKVVLDVAGGAAGLVLPSLLGRIGVDVLTVDNRLSPTGAAVTLAEHLRQLERLGELVSSSRAAFGVRFDGVGERIALVDERGRFVPDDRALLVLLDLVAAERHSGLAALPVTTTRVAEQVTGFHGTGVLWTTTSPHDLTAAARRPDVVFAGDGRGGFVVPEFSPVIDGTAAFVRLLGLVARTRLTLSQIDARIPLAQVVRRDVPTPWAVKGQVMRRVLEEVGDREVDTTDGVRVVEPDGSWALVLPDPASAVTHLWAEAATAGAATGLVGRWAEVVEAASAHGHPGDGAV